MAVACAGLALTLQTSPARALTLDDAIAIALERSPRMASATWNAEAAASLASAASHDRFPRLEASLTGLRSNQPVIVFGGLLSQERFAPENLGSLDPETGEFDLSPLNSPAPVTHFRYALSLRQPLWTGGALTAQLDGKRAEARAAQATRFRTREELAFAVEQTFRSAVLAQTRLRVLRESLAVARAEGARVESLWTEGLALLSDRRALDAHLLETQAMVALSESDSVVARSHLGMLLGADEPVEDALVDPGPPVDGSRTLADALAGSTERGDVRAVEGIAEAADADRRLARSAWFPAIELGGMIEHNSNEVFGSGGNQWTVALLASWRLDTGTGSRNQGSAQAMEAARSRVQAARDQAAHDVRTAYSRIQASGQRVKALEAAVAASTESFRLVRERHAEGLATTLQLTESQNTLTRTRLEAATARQDLAMAHAALRLAAGNPDIEELSP